MPKLSYEEYFDSRGNFKFPVDPYRDTESDFYKLFFAADGDYWANRGNLQKEAEEWLIKFVDDNRRKFDAACSAARMLISNDFARNTKGNYSTVYMWR